MVTGIIALISSLLGITFWLMKRHAAKADDPGTQDKVRYAQIDKDLVKRDSAAATLHADDDLDALDRLQHSKSDQR